MNQLDIGTKKHFVILDGLRGVAALAVVIFHFMEWVFTDFSRNFIAHGFLAVDFFFCLSGFVIAYAYDDRIKEIGKAKFLKLRLIRLHPLVILGSLLGLLGFLLDPYDSTTYSQSMLAMLVLTSMFLIPMPVMADRAFNLFGLNAPSWSLFWEYVANIFYALILHRLDRRLLVALLAVGAGMLAVVAHDAGNLLGGWAGDNFWDGGARVFYSFVAGILIFRYNLIIRNRIGFPLLAVMLFLAFVMPWGEWRWVTELFIVVIYFPFLISLGAGSALSQRFEKVCHFSGDISYPLYMTHYWAIWIFGHYFTNVNPSMHQVFFVTVGGVIFLIAFAYASMRVFDIPIRRYFK